MSASTAPVPETMEGLRRQNSAYRTLCASMEEIQSHHTQQGRKYQEAITTLDSEREANALLTDRIAELEARVAKLDLDLEAAQCLMDSQYKAGIKLGWNLCVDDDEAGYQRVTSGTEHIAALKRIQAERAALNPSARSE